MLYERWAKVAAARRKEFALRDTSSGQRWTFGELFEAGEAQAVVAGDFAQPQGQGAGFVLALLGAWRGRKIVCPLEPGQSLPAIPKPPPNCVHLKATSATTGMARTIVFTGDQLAADAENIVKTMGLRPDWPNLGVISMAHSYGFSNLVLPLLLHGIPLVLVPAPLPETLLQAARGEAALTLPAVPAMWRAWYEAKSIPPNVRLAISAGAPLPLEIERAVFASCGLKIHNFYGSSECGGIAYDAGEGPRDDDACVGAPMRGVSLSADEDGRLVVRSDAVGETYWPDADGTLGAGRFQTSDLVELKDGLVFLHGRTSDIINVAGRKVSPLTIERALVEHPAVGACLVFGAPGRDAGRAEDIVACVVSREPVAGEVLKQFMLERIPAWQLPREWWFVDSLEPNSRGKISRAEWRQRYLESRR